jgi:hypothetical protein
MQNGAIWGHFKVSYNIESSTILMTLIDKNLVQSVVGIITFSNDTVGSPSGYFSPEIL